MERQIQGRRIAESSINTGDKHWVRLQILLISISRAGKHLIQIEPSQIHATFSLKLNNKWNKVELQNLQ